MDKAPLPTPWNFYNLVASPFFQGYLSADIHASAPLSLFVGRAAELNQLRTRIHGAGNQGTRQAVSGAPGVGKTTLVQETKALLQTDEYLTSNSFVSVQPGDRLHFLLVGTSDAIGTVVDTHQQLRSVVATVRLASLSRAEVKELLKARYRHLRRDLTRAFIQPVADEVVENLHQLEALWNLSRGGVSLVVNHLVRQGYVVAHPRKKRQPIQYTLSGTSALIFGMHA